MAATVRLLENRWDDSYAAGLDEPGKLLYRSNLLGADKRITNYGGGNTSAKVMETDPLTGEKVKVLWVKGSGGDVGTIKLDGFATLYQDKLESLKSIYKGVEDEDRMVGFLPHCTFNLNARAASIDTPLHGFVPFTHVDHMHPDAIIAIAASRNSRELTKQIFGDEIGWLPWRRPGFQLGLDLEAFVKANPNAKGVVLESHGLFTWANDAKACYELTLDIINKAIEWFAAQTEGKTIFGGAAVQSLPVAERRAIAARLMPEIRGRIGKQERKLGHFDDQDAVLEFVNSKNLRPLGALGTSCPDHFLRTKIRPLIIDFDPAKPDVDAIVAGLDKALEDYRADYARYYNDCKHDNSPAMRDANPVIFLVPGVGMLSFARDKATARIASEFYVNAINVMRGASTVSEYQGLPEQEAFDIEYWLLEEAKLQRMPKPKSLAGRVAFVTGGAGGIGRATAARLVGEGACVVLADIDQSALESTEADFVKTYGADAVRTVKLDVTKEDAVISSFARILRRVRRRRYSGLQCRYRVVGADRKHRAFDVEQEHRYSHDRLFPRLARSLPAVPQAESRRQRRLRRVEEWSCFFAERRGLLHGQGCRNSSCPMPGAGRRGGRHSRQYGEPGCGAARLQDLERRVARTARGLIEDRGG